MPERNFEQQARDMANGFEMKPKPDVWLNVRNAIGEPRRKRRIVLWWWLLPLGLLSSSIALYMLRPNGKEVQVKKAISTTPKANETVIEQKLSTNKPSTIKQQIKKENKNGIVKTQKKSSKKQRLTESSPTYNLTYEKDKGNKVLSKGVVTVSKTSKRTASKDEKINHTNILSENKDKNNMPENSIDALENQQASILKKSVNAALLSKDSALSKTATQADSTTSIVTTKQKNKTKLHWGIFAEGGIATRKSSVLPIANFEKSSNNQFSAPMADGVGSSIIGLVNGRTFYYSNNIKHGFAFGFGIAVQRPISRSIDVFADVAYHYQSFEVTTTAYKDSLVLNNLFRSFAGSYEAKQTFHFSSLFAGINWHFINTKQVQFGISAGIDNLLLLEAKQKLNGITSLNFSLENAQQISDSTFAKKDFYRYQPSIFAGVLVNIKLGDQQLQLIPFTRSSFRQFDKHATGSNNHLFSTGLRAVYFFR